MAPTRRTTRRVSDSASITRRLRRRCAGRPAPRSRTRTGYRRTAIALFDQRSQSRRRRRPARRCGRAVRTSRGPACTGVALGVRHAKEAANVRTASWPALRATRARFPWPPRPSRCGRSAGRESGTEQPARRDVVAGTAKFARHVGRHSCAVRVARHDPRAAFPARTGRGLFLHGEVGATLYDRFDAPQCRCDFLRCHGSLLRVQFDARRL